MNELRLYFFRWQKMYEEMYSDLETVRNLLVTQYDINLRMREEVRRFRVLKDISVVV